MKRTRLWDRADYPRKTQSSATQGAASIEHYTSLIIARVNKNRAGCWETQTGCKEYAITTCFMLPDSRGRRLRKIDRKTTKIPKEQEVVDEAIKYQLDIVALSSMKHQGSGLLNLNGWKLFYSMVDMTMRAGAAVGILVEPN
ncbi:unnamed protein product [Soboliphyme baturini]|uniref:CN hydrolase domain-containing protein n=1 Tax=Soboliphyme baturini TaxID=241478 RepID=A0A183ITH3_9BILA|nr:unnamed protein product [Soboliphyme baturini]